MQIPPLTLDASGETRTEHKGLITVTVTGSHFFVAHMGETRNAQTTVVGKLERPRRTWEDNINTDVRELRGRTLVNTVMNHNRREIS
jgi:hypothetical protein